MAVRIQTGSTNTSPARMAAPSLRSPRNTRWAQHREVWEVFGTPVERMPICRCSRSSALERSAKGCDWNTGWKASTPSITPNFAGRTQHLWIRLLVPKIRRLERSSTPATLRARYRWRLSSIGRPLQEEDAAGETSKLKEKMVEAAGVEPMSVLIRHKLLIL